MLIFNLKPQHMKHLLISCFALLAATLSATHNRAGEILYKRIAPFTQPGGTTPVYTYSITVIKYMDDGQGVADRCVDTVYFGDGTKGVAPRINTGLTSCSCGTLNNVAIGCGSLMVNDPSYKVKYSVYSIVHTYSYTSNFTVRSMDPNRNPGIINIPNSSAEPFTIEATIMINASTGNNSSPIFTIAPIDQATIGVCFTHSLGAIDADGDSISYDPMVCLGANGAAIAGYTYPGFGSQTYSVNAFGVLTWCVPQTVGEYNLAIKVKEWRKNSSGIYQVIGYTMRDMQVLVRPGPLGVDNYSSGRDLEVFPNPFSDQLELEAGHAKINAITLFSMDGKQVPANYSARPNGKIRLHVEGLSSGIYLLQVSTDQGELHRKIVKQE